MISEDEYRCNNTIDLEEWLNMAFKEVKQHVKAIVKYQSGREETVHGKINRDGSYHKSFQDSVDKFRKFPTVINVEVVEY